MEATLTNNGWLALNEYSAKYRVSLSTLRRRIRSGEVQSRFEEGKYWLRDAPLARQHKSVHIPEEMASVEVTKPAAPQDAPIVAAVDSEATIVASNLMKSAQQMMQELKSAYVSVLHEKEEQIMQLKKENADLKTLVQILEGETDRLKLNLGESAPIDSWLDNNL
jgi:hypothetical protein